MFTVRKEMRRSKKRLDQVRFKKKKKKRKKSAHTHENLVYFAGTWQHVSYAMICEAGTPRSPKPEHPALFLICSCIRA